MKFAIDDDVGTPTLAPILVHIRPWGFVHK